MFLASPSYPSAMAQRQPRILAQIVLTVLALLLAAAAWAQSVNYTVQIDAPRDLRKLLEENLDLVRWRGNPRLDLAQLQRLVKDAPEQVKTLVATEGYYSPTVSVGLDTSGAVPVARVIVDPGPPVLVGHVDLVVQAPVPPDKGEAPLDTAALRASWELPVGRRFRQADWEAAKRNLLRRITQKRFPRALLAESSATVDPEAHRAQLRVVVDTGPEARLGELRIRGLKRYPATVITNLNPIKPGEVYDETVLQAFQARLQDTGYFASVEVSADMRALLGAELGALAEGEEPGAAPKPAPMPAGPVVLPVVVRVTENKAKNAEVGLGLSTNTGARAQLSYDDLNVFGKRMKSDLIYEQKRQNARVDFYWPTTPKGYNDSIGGGIERTDVRNQILTVASIAARRAWGSPLLERSVTLELLTEKRVIDDLPSTRSKSLPLTYSITKRKLDSLVQPTRGYVVNAQLGGALLPLLTDEQFVRAYARFVNYRPLGSSGALVLRGEAGAVGSRQKVGVPSSLLFRAGGDQSVRGYAYQQLGVREGDAIVGARYLLTASAEYQYWFKPPWGAAVFLDAGNAADSWSDMRPKLGYGVGARYRSPVGPINVDVAYGQAVKQVRLHFSLGFTF
jgi:translocation and assembly module TamA